MNTVTVNTSRQYNVHIGPGLLSTIGNQLRVLGQNGKAAVISDTNVWNIYGQKVTDSLLCAGFDVCHYVFPAGEESKNGETYLSILDFLAKNKITRSDCLIALGGGVTGDMTGFAAATYLRGISYIQVPTSLLAMVDSSVGGKTAIDLPAGKNLVGAFYQPSVVLCDTDTLSTLPKSFFYDGCAEVIKYGVLYDQDLFAHLQEKGPDFDREYVVHRCVCLKRDVVVADEFDRGERQKLNLGHTIGHAVEKNSNFTISHGCAVAIGMSVITKCAAKLKYCSPDLPAVIDSLLAKFNLPADTTFSADEICSGALSDKKRFGQTLNLIIPEKIGNCNILPCPVESLKSLIEAGL